MKLRVFKTLKQHTLGEMLAAGLCATINSDDPAYFGGYVGENFKQAASVLKLTAGELGKLAKNSFEASFLEPSEKARHLAEIETLLPNSSCC